MFIEPVIRLRRKSIKEQLVKYFDISFSDSIMKNSRIFFTAFLYFTISFLYAIFFSIHA